MHKLLPVVYGLFALVVFIGCAASDKTSQVHPPTSSEHAAIHAYLEQSKQRHNRFKDFDLSRCTKDARIDTQYDEQDVFLSPRELKTVWHRKIAIIKSHEFRLRDIAVKDISIQGNTAYVKTQRTFVSERWRTKHECTVHQVFKKRDSEWKLHKSRVQSRTCTACHH